MLRVRRMRQNRRGDLVLDGLPPRYPQATHHDASKDEGRMGLPRKLEAAFELGEWCAGLL